MAPILYSRTTCPHCQTVKQFIRANGLSRYVVIRDVDHDPGARDELRRYWPSAGVPTLIYNGRVLAGDATEVIDALRAMFRIPATQAIRPAGQAASPTQQQQSSSIPWGPIVLIGGVIGFGLLEFYMTNFGDSKEQTRLPRSM